MTITNTKQSVWDEFERRSDSDNYETEKDGMDMSQPNDSFFNPREWPESQFEIDPDKIKAFIQSRFLPKDELREKVEALRTTETPNVPQGYPKMLGYNRALDAVLGLLD